MSEATSTAGAPSTNVFRPPTAMIPGPTSFSASSVSQAFHFSSRNPRIEETRGFMPLYHTPFTCLLDSNSNKDREEATGETVIVNRRIVMMILIVETMTIAIAMMMMTVGILNAIDTMVVKTMMVDFPNLLFSSSMSPCRMQHLRLSPKLPHGLFQLMRSLSRSVVRGVELAEENKMPPSIGAVRGAKAEDEWPGVEAALGGAGRRVGGRRGSEEKCS
ncbi:hypothetical protein LOK49_LG10G00430 [Camellia lanceoleosa]|uniref:Uncharacterized protein n=1 Tax=Camellia lanceoleosa TaxID=1840588 RepID=A0ACC0GAP7_9ERIC|nr:hypothetical protein LOK49_LG10G00430 [Camellia lanceoleosa]